MSPDKNQRFFNTRTILFVMVIPLLAGLLLASFIPQPQIGLIVLTEPIYYETGQMVIEQIRYAYDHPDIKGVVLALDCPGGTINDTELVYLELKRLRQKMPVVTMVQGLSASGAYYLSMATDTIFANPSAMVGNVGVIGQIPPPPIVFEEIYSTGPYKFWGSARDTYVRQIDMMKRSFLGVVQAGRGERLMISLEKVSRGEIYPASEALGYGLVDQLGSQSDAIEETAKRAHINHFQVIDLSSLVNSERGDATTFYRLDGEGNITNYPANPGSYYLYVENFEEGSR